MIQTRLSPLLFALLLPLAAAYADDRRTVMAGDFDDDIYLAGEDVTVNARVDGDVIAAGGHVLIENSVDGDVAAAGGQVVVDAQVGDDVRAAGGRVSLNSRILGDAIAAGGHVSLAKTALVGGRAWLAGGTVEVEGGVAGELRAAGGEVILAGTVDGDARVYAKSLKVLPGARITGRLDYYGPTGASIAPEAMIGAFAHHPLGDSASPDEGDGRSFALMFYFILGITGIVLYLIFPRFALGAMRTLGTRPGASLMLGLAALFALPPIALLLMMTLVGFLMGLLLLGFYTLLLLAGFLTGMLFVGDRLLRLLRHGEDVPYSKRLLSLIAALLILWLIGFVPIAGALTVFLLLAFGMGAALLRMWGNYKDTGLRA
ncbi:MAG: polymer-forming cytoskeletal protein [Gammaproteobacteria bacterium]|nr:polymer-forming cytoskeletal protein [Gammaproteobacteria bacterium]